MSKSSSNQKSTSKISNNQAHQDNRDDTPQAPVDPNEKLRALLESNEALPSTLKDALIKHLDKAGYDSTAENHSSNIVDQNSLFSSVFSQIKQTPVQVIDKVSNRVNQTVETIRSDKLEQVKNEVRRWVDQVDLQAEAIKLLAQLSIELKTSIRLVPDQESKLGLKPEVNTKAQLKWGVDQDQNDHSDSKKN